MIIRFIKRCISIKIGGNLIKTLFYNFSLLPKKQAIYLPLTIGSYTVINVKSGGKIKLEDDFDRKNAHIYIGLKCLDWLPQSEKTMIIVKGELNLHSDICIGSGTSFEIGENAVLSLNTGFNITGRSTIICKKQIDFASDVLISWNTLIMDSDAHSIIQNNKTVNKNKNIFVGKHSWIGAKSTILAGTVLADNTIVACGAVVKGYFSKNNTLLAGVPAAIIKENISWSIQSSVS